MNYELQSLTAKLGKIEGKQELLRTQLSSIDSKVDLLTTRKNNLDTLGVIVKQASERTQQKIAERFNTIVQSCIDVVFPNTYKFIAEFVTRRNQTELDFAIEKDGQRMNPTTSNGGGLVDVISLALRVACLTMSKGEKILLLDEPCPHLRIENRDSLGELFEMLAKDIGIQIIMVGDVGGSYIKNCREFRVTNCDGISSVEVINDRLSENS